MRLTTRGDSAEIETEITYQTCRGYVMLPHQFGFDFNGKKYGIGANRFLTVNDKDEMTGDPTARYVPCRVEAIKGVADREH